MLPPLMSRTLCGNTVPRLSCSLSTSPSSYLNLRPLPAVTKQRRYSSSKPSSPSNDDSRPITTPTNGPAKTDSSVARKRSYSKPGRPKAKDNISKGAEASANTPAYSLPSVPSTQHLNRQDVHVAALFSLHRPISVVSPVPLTTTAKSFSSIFSSSKSDKPRTTKVIFTLSSAIQTLDKSVAQAEQQNSTSPAQQLTPAEADLQQAVTQASQSNAEPTHPDGQSVYVSIEELAKNLRPFVPPPPPVPVNDMAQNGFSGATNASSILQLDMPAAVVEELHVEDRPPVPRQPFLERMHTRRMRWEKSQEIRFREKWLAISVRRQRKLRMKKHKYKKLMKRTRNLRRRQDRL